MAQYISDAIALGARIFSVYFLIISLFAFARRRHAPAHGPVRRFAILIAARNEEKCIAGTVQSLLEQRYPADKFTVFVLPNNCTDKTETAARRAGAEILTMPSWVKSKGAALTVGLRELMSDLRHFDAFCVFDADNEPSPGFLAAMDASLVSARAAKSRILSKNRESSWVSACYEIYFCLANRFLNRARENLGLSARLIGTGFALRRDYLEEHPFSSETITEDAELFAALSAQGERVAFCEEAVTYDEDPESFSVSLTQRRRWMSGIMQVALLKAGALFRGLRTDGAALCFDCAMQLGCGFVQALAPAGLLLGLLAAPLATLAALPSACVCAYICCALTAVAALALERRLCRGVIKGILMYPLFMLSFVPLQTLALIKKTTVWKPIAHTGAQRLAAK